MDRGIKNQLAERLTKLLGLDHSGESGGGEPGWALEEVGYVANSPTTAGLYRIRYTSGWNSLFVKVLSTYERWPMVHLLAGDFRAVALGTDLWRYEADVYLDRLSGSLPVGLRLPQVYCVEELDRNHLVMVVEDVATAPAPWDRERYGHAAELLGKLNARLTRNDALPASAVRTPGWLTRSMFSGFVERFALPPLLDPATWTHPLLAESDLRQDLADLADRVPALLDDLASRPQLMSHGDACPQNLLVPADQPDGFVAIDWTASGLVAAGDDLGQLLIGRAHAGELGVPELAELRELVIRRYHAGLVSEECADIGEDDVRAGLDGSLIARNAFLSVPLDKLDEPLTDELAAMVAKRLELTRYLVGLGAASLTA